MTLTNRKSIFIFMLFMVFWEVASILGVTWGTRFDCRARKLVTIKLPFVFLLGLQKSENQI